MKGESVKNRSKVLRVRQERNIDFLFITNFQTNFNDFYMNNNKKFTYIYLGLVLIRLIINLNSFSFIHPDEFFQNSEITSNLIFNYSNNYDSIRSELPFKSWEWHNENPCRSLLPILSGTGIGFWLLKKLIVGKKERVCLLFIYRVELTICLLIDSPSAYALLITQRLCMFFLSLLIG